MMHFLVDICTQNFIRTEKDGVYKSEREASMKFWRCWVGLWLCAIADGSDKEPEPDLRGVVAH